MYCPCIKRTSFILFASFCFVSCSIQQKISKSANKLVIHDSSLLTAHVGISIYEPASGRFWYNYQGDKYFVPASNTKIPTCYAAMKYLGDSLAGARVSFSKDSVLEIYPTGDPTFLNTAFSYQPVYEKMKQQKKIILYINHWQEERWGSGWAWNDYDASYMTERSVLPLYGNQIDFSLSRDTLKIFPPINSVHYDSILGFNAAARTIRVQKFRIERSLDENMFYLKPAENIFTRSSIPFRTSISFIRQLLEDTLKAEIVPAAVAPAYHPIPQKKIICSQPTDSLLKPMMHRSDNFFAEQTLLMVSNEMLGVMNDEKIIDTILKTDFKDLPQKPRWADGSGLSRYNLFTPQSLVAILTKMKNEFPMERIREILPTGGEGTLSNYYVADSGFIYAKTGTLSGVVALSGYLYTKRDKLLIFSVLVNNHRTSAAAVRRAVEKFIQTVRNKF
jgi:D-alanyl-D-alanine carboxypeptidase/D-alanyl-D-alanine-endopeptidase (penicillin-binding protein 4)